jgi:tetratricopeptide (TPR) repeat protein
MNSKMPVIKQTAVISVIPHFLILALLIYAISFIISDILNQTIAAIMIYYVILYSLRHIAWHHRKGMKFYKKRDYSKAIPMFLKSYNFFKNHEWLDKYRFIFLLSSSHLTYREMALINIAFCNTQIKEGQEAKKYYELAMKEFPESQMAKMGLNMMEASKNINN